jgi:hypothetical protein
MRRTRRSSTARAASDAIAADGDGGAASVAVNMGADNSASSGGNSAYEDGVDDSGTDDGDDARPVDDGDDDDDDNDDDDDDDDADDDAAADDADDVADGGATDGDDTRCASDDDDDGDDDDNDKDTSADAESDVRGIADADGDADSCLCFCMSSGSNEVVSVSRDGSSSFAAASMAPLTRLLVLHCTMNDRKICVRVQAQTQKGGTWALLHYVDGGNNVEMASHEPCLHYIRHDVRHLRRGEDGGVGGGDARLPFSLGRRRRRRCCSLSLLRRRHFLASRSLGGISGRGSRLRVGRQQRRQLVTLRRKPLLHR